MTELTDELMEKAFKAFEAAISEHVHAETATIEEKRLVISYLRAAILRMARAQGMREAAGLINNKDLFDGLPVTPDMHEGAGCLHLAILARAAKLEAE